MIPRRVVVQVDAGLLRRAMSLSGIRAKGPLVTLALRSLVRHLEQMEILRSRGKVVWDGDLDEMRGRVRR